MFNVLVILIVIASILMIGIVLIQKSKGGGLASNFASSNQIMGVRKTNSFVEQATWTLAIVICVLSIASAFFVPKPAQNAAQSRVQTTSQPATATPDFSTPAKNDAPATPASTPAQPAAEKPAN